MATKAGLFVLLGVVTLCNGQVVKATYGPKCLSCTGVRDPTECTSATTCWSSQQCYTERYVHAEGHALYDLGCKIKDECDLISRSRKKRMDIIVDLCEECCTEDFCNANICPDPTGMPSLMCYSCEDVANPKDCHVLSRCGQNEICYGEKLITDSPHPRHTLGCLSKEVCGLLDNGDQSLLGILKRALNSGKSKRSTHLCQKCCSGAGCNSRVCEEEHQEQVTGVDTSLSFIYPTTPTELPPEITPERTRELTPTNTPSPLSEGPTDPLTWPWTTSLAPRLSEPRDRTTEYSTLWWTTQRPSTTRDRTTNTKAWWWTKSTTEIPRITRDWSTTESPTLDPTIEPTTWWWKDWQRTSTIPQWTNLPSTPAPIGGVIRLRGGNQKNEGRVEILHDGIWGTVCDDGFDDNAASVVCHMAGYLRFGAVSTGSAGFGHGSGFIWLDDIKCSGEEDSLEKCSHANYGSNDCTHKEDAGVRCLKLDEFDIRLVGGSSSNEGRLEVYHNREWGTVCDDNFGDAEASIVCNMLSYQRNGAVAHSNAHFGQGQGQIWLDEVMCTGSEASILSCRHKPWGEHNCRHSDDVGVSCVVPHCPEGFSKYHSSCYVFIASYAYSYEEADTQCNLFNASLVSIESAGEQEFIVDILKAVPAYTGEWMTSGKRWNNYWTWDVEGARVPMDMEPLIWLSGKPTTGPCLSIITYSNYALKDVNCVGHNRNFICENKLEIH